MSRWFRLVSLLTAFSALWAVDTRSIYYEASYLGIPLLDMTLTKATGDSTVQITYDNSLKPLISVFHAIHNVYRVEFYKDSFQPIRWSKDISEGALKFQFSGWKSTQAATVYYSNGQIGDLPPGAFTIFSATHYLAAHAHEIQLFPLKLTILIDGDIWEATAKRYDARSAHLEHHIKPDEVLIQTDLHHVAGHSLIPENDILTNVIATEGTRFLLWVSPDGSYSRAQFGSFPKAVVLQRKF